MIKTPIAIIGSGAFGTFLNGLLKESFEIVEAEESKSVILAVPISAYDECGQKYKSKHLINVCSVQLPSTKILLKHTRQITSIHPLFGARTPPEFRNSILTFRFGGEEGETFLNGFRCLNTIYEGLYNPESHDQLMARTHKFALNTARKLEPLIDKEIPDYLVPHSYRLLKNFVSTLLDAPQGTIESIESNIFNY